MSDDHQNNHDCVMNHSLTSTPPGSHQENEMMEDDHSEQLHHPTQQQQQQQHIILFYKYHPLSADKTIVEMYRTALEQLCQSLHLQGRILVGCNEYQSEGINGTLSGTFNELNIFVRALTTSTSTISYSNHHDSYNISEVNDVSSSTLDDRSEMMNTILNDFWTTCDYFYRQADCVPLIMDPTDFKWSQATLSPSDSPSSSSWSSNGSPFINAITHDNTDSTTTIITTTPSTISTSLFPDLNIKIVKELIGTGGILATIPLDEVGEGYLTPKEWHERLKEYNNNNNNNRKQQQRKRQHEDAAENGSNNDDNNDADDDSNDTILIDCRNTKECQIGHFEGAVDPKTTTFSQFTQWVDDHQQSLSTKKTILMYCTGGIRCEKSSAYIRRTIPSVQEVRHLKGGIHKYLEEFGGNNSGSSTTATVGEDGTDTTAVSASSLPTQSMWRGKNFVFDGRGAHGPIPSGTLPDTRSSSPTHNSSSDTYTLLKQCPPGTDHDNDNDQRTARASKGRHDNNNTSSNNINDDNIVGSCRYCAVPYDTFHPHCVCTVCREPTLVCPSCQQNSVVSNHEYHCKAHQHLQSCYYTNLEPYTYQELQQQLHDLQQIMADIAVGRKYKQRRKTLSKQCDKIILRLQELEMSTGGNSNIHQHETKKSSPAVEWKCRNCGQVGCSGTCWGFHGLKRKHVLESQQQQQQQHQQQQQRELDRSSKNNEATTKTYINQHNLSSKTTKKKQKQDQIDEWVRLGLTQAPSVGRNPTTGLRVPAPCTRIIETKTKGKWCGLSLMKVLQTEFPDLTKTVQTLPNLLRRGLIRVNGTSVRSLDEAESLRLKNMDVISRVIHWHEPPIHLPDGRIGVEKISIPKEALPANNNSNSCADGNINGDNNMIYVCNKPSTVPVHPAGPYLSNTLTILVEAQEGLMPKSLIPCHRIDRATSGLTVCCTDVSIARMIQTTIDQGRVRKQYIAKVHGRFPSSSPVDPTEPHMGDSLPPLTDDAMWKWVDGDVDDNQDEDSMNKGVMVLQVDAPIETIDPANGIRKITPNGKPSTSRFELLQYDSPSNTSIIRCIPITGRSHQLRVHLQWLGHPIVQDIQYGGTFVRDGVDGMDTTTVFMHHDSSAGIQVEDVTMEHPTSSSTSSSSTNTSNDAVLSRTTTTSSTTTSNNNDGIIISSNDVRSAREVCPLCQIGPSAAFTPAQLLQGGHAICLHAYRYSLFLPVLSLSENNPTTTGGSLPSKRKKKVHCGNKREQEDSKSAATSQSDCCVVDNENTNNRGGKGDYGGEKFVQVDLSVDLPPWASFSDEERT